jgi:hypothetical protein
MPPFDEQVCLRLPLADAVFQLLHFISPADFLAELYQRHRGASYERDIPFATFFALIRDALLSPTDSAHQVFRRAQGAGRLDASVQAVYGKLARAPLPLSQGLLTETAHRLRDVFPDAGDPLPASLRAFPVYAFDGKKIKFLARRLKPLRGLKGQVLGGKLLVVQDVATGLAVALQADPDGETADNPLVAGAVAQVRQRTAGPRLWVGDRLFCDLVQIPLLRAADDDHFVLRYQAKVGFHPDPARAPAQGQDGRGVPYTEEWGWLGAAGRPDRVYVRRITLHRRPGPPIILVTDLLDGDRYPAADLLEVYRRRWGIEVLFQRVTEVFDLRHLIGATPAATVFQAALCFVLANVVQAVQGYIAAAQHRSPQTIAPRVLFADVQRQLTAWAELVTVEQTLAWLRARVSSGADLRAYLGARLAAVWQPRWHKVVPKRRSEPTPARGYLKGGHSSVYRIMHGQHEVLPLPNAATKPGC